MSSKLVAIQSEVDITPLGGDAVDTLSYQDKQEEWHINAVEPSQKVARVVRIEKVIQPLPDVESIASTITSEIESGDVLADLPSYDKDVYFNADHRMNLSRLAKSVLERKNGITMHELTLDVANKHGLTRSSKKQRQYLRQVISSWAGFWRKGEEKTTVFLSPADITEEIAWRGLYAFGVERDWKGLCYQEQIGIARAALAAQPSAPVDWLFNEFNIARRHHSTADVFQAWIDRVNVVVK